MLIFFLVALLCKSSLQAVSPPNGQVIVLESKRLFSVSPNHISTGCTCHHCPGGCMYRAWQWLHLPPVPPWLPGGSHQEVPGGSGTAPAAPLAPATRPLRLSLPGMGAEDLLAWQQALHHHLWQEDPVSGDMCLLQSQGGMEDLILMQSWISQNILSVC